MVETAPANGHDTEPNLQLDEGWTSEFAYLLICYYFKGMCSGLDIEMERIQDCNDGDSR